MKRKPGTAELRESSAIARIDTMLGMGKTASEIAKAVGRSTSYVESRMVMFRAANRPSVEDARIDYIKDQCFIALTMQQGGLPRAMTLNGLTVWVGPDGKPWRRAA